MPGFIIDKVISVLLPYIEREKSPTNTILRNVSFSCINYAAFSWLILLLYDNKKWLWLLVIVILIIGPLLIGWGLAKILKKSFVNIKLLPTAWDYYFNQEKPAWVLITLKNGKLIGGFFSQKSFASTGDYDIYIQEVWKVDKEGRFIKPIKDSDGFIIKNSEIKYIEFFKVKPKKSKKEGKDG